VLAGISHEALSEDVDVAFTAVMGALSSTVRAFSVANGPTRGYFWSQPWARDITVVSLTATVCRL
jgi:hypothetical protein